MWVYLVDGTLLRNGSLETWSALWLALLKPNSDGCCEISHRSTLEATIIMKLELLITPLGEKLRLVSQYPSCKWLHPRNTVP
uniref:Uncharacterized protein n=1 Tax=Arundo donax TaxID=35708 RepID=A0A0A9DLR9_ARUDO